MNSVNKTLVTGLLTISTLACANEGTHNSIETQKKLLVGILNVISLVFPSEQVYNALEAVYTKKYSDNENIIDDLNMYDDPFKLMQSNSLQREDQSTVSQLTTRETDVLNLMAEGLMNKEIAKQLYLSEATIKNHVTSILRKLNATVRTEAVVTAIKYGMVFNSNTRN